MVIKVIGVFIVLGLSACSSHPVIETLPAQNKTNLAVTFETTSADRQKARDQGKPVLLRGTAANYPDNVDPSKLGHGWVQCEMEILANGDVGEIIILDSADPLFHEPAQTALRSWKFEPSSHDRRLVHRLFIRGTQATHYQPSTTTQ